MSRVCDKKVKLSLTHSPRLSGGGNSADEAQSARDVSDKSSVIHTADREAPRCRPTNAHVMYCQVARLGGRWLWCFALANHKFRTRQEGSDFQELIIRTSEFRKSRLCCSVALLAATSDWNVCLHLRGDHQISCRSYVMLIDTQ